MPLHVHHVMSAIGMLLARCVSRQPVGSCARVTREEACLVGRYAASNTRRGVESCGILAGLLDEKAGCFQISTLIIPKQEGTSDTVQARAPLHACMLPMSPR